MSNAGAHATTFYRYVAKNERLWTIRDDAGYPAPLVSSGKRSQPFWSSVSRVQLIIKNAEAYIGFEPEELDWWEFRKVWAPRLKKEGLLVGVNWSGPLAVGYDLPPELVVRAIAGERARSGMPTSRLGKYVRSVFGK